MIQSQRGCLRRASTCLPSLLLHYHYTTCRCHLSLFRRDARMRTSFLVLRSRRFLVEISRITTDRFRTAISFQATRGGRQSPVDRVSVVGRTFSSASINLL